MGKGKGRGRGRGRGRGQGGPKSPPVEQQQSKQKSDIPTNPQQYAEADEKTPVKVPSATTPAEAITTQTDAKATATNVTTEKKDYPVQPELKQQEKDISAVRPRKNSKNGETYSIGSSTAPATRRGSGFQLPKRPGVGKAGRKIQLYSNFFAIKIPNVDIYHYDVTISEGSSVDKTPKEFNRKLIEKMAGENKKFFGCRPVYDGKKNLFSKNPLSFNGAKDFMVEFKEDDSDRLRKLKVTLKWAANVNLQSLQNAIKGEANASINQDAITALDLVLRHAASLKYIPIGSKFFTSTGSVNIGYGREIWHGYHQSVRPTRWKMLINVDVSATTFYRNIDVIEFLYDITQYDCTKTNRDLTDAQRHHFNKEIKGLKIEINYMGNQRRKYRVNGLTRSNARDQKFPFEKDGRKYNISVQEYFRTEKNVNLKYPFLNCLHVGNVSKNVYIPMECCRLVKGQQCKKKLNEELTQQMIKETARRPHERMKTIQDKVNEANFKTDPYIKGFDIDVNLKMETVEARVLPTPGILYDQNRKMNPSGGAWNMKGIRLYHAASIPSWGLILYSCRMNEQQALKFQDELIRAANSIGISMGKPVYQRIASNRDSPEKIVTEAIMKDPAKMSLLVVVLPGKTPFYGELKRICETEIGYKSLSEKRAVDILKTRGMCTQCIQSKNALKCNPMTLAQLCLKINAKMGGVNNAIDSQNKFTRPARVFNEPVIFLGADVTHPGAGDRSSPSIAAVVGSVDAYPIRYAVSVRVQKHREEVITDLENITIELLTQFYINLKKKPAKIIMFRDGVSEGQFQQVLLHELGAIQRACTKLEKGYQPAITFIVVQKRHHARFNVMDRKDADRSGNCPPGTTVDTNVCHPSEFDYYQYSHAGIQGTSRPTHYHVLWDDTNFNADEMQALSFMLCHLYVRCTRSVSIPAPAYYAHHVAFRARYHLQKELGSSTSDSSDSGELAQRMSDLNFKDIVKPHPRLLSMMYFV